MEVRRYFSPASFPKFYSPYFCCPFLHLALCSGPSALTHFLPLPLSLSLSPFHVNRRHPPLSEVVPPVWLTLLHSNLPLRPSASRAQRGSARLAQTHRQKHLGSPATAAYCLPRWPVKSSQRSHRKAFKGYIRDGQDILRRLRHVNHDMTMATAHKRLSAPSHFR